MAEIIWTEPALSDLDQIADHIAFDNPQAAAALVRRIFNHVDQLREHPKSGSVPPELRPLRNYRQLVDPPCRVFYRIGDNGKIFIVHIMRGERLLKRRKLKRGH